jgi:hypothetical protein
MRGEASVAVTTGAGLGQGQRGAARAGRHVEHPHAGTRTDPPDRLAREGEGQRLECLLVQGDVIVPASGRWSGCRSAALVKDDLLEAGARQAVRRR